MRIWFDTEFIDDGKTIDLISIGMVNEKDEMLYMENGECDLDRACSWVKKNVIPYLTGEKHSRKEIADAIWKFSVSDNTCPEFWAYFCSYDWVALCQLYGRMIDLPTAWPMFCRDLKCEVAKYPEYKMPKMKSGIVHNALDDALHLKYSHLDFERWIVQNMLMYR